MLKGTNIVYSQSHFFTLLCQHDLFLVKQNYKNVYKAYLSSTYRGTAINVRFLSHYKLPPY